jgi:predicted dehydrogenase
LKTFNVLILGCGSIAGGYDSSDLAPENINTHAKAYLRHQGFILYGCVDPNQARRESFRKQWDIKKSYATLIEALNDDIEYEVVSVCSPTEQHFNDLTLLIDTKPRIVFCEKPISENLQKTKEIVNKFQSLGIGLVVNHNRRWDQDLQNFKMELTKGEWGRVRSVVGYYNKGIINNGTHLVDLLQDILGKISLVSVGNRIDDYLVNDPSLSAMLSSESGVGVHLVPGNSKDFTIFEVHFLTEKGFVSIEGSGRYWRRRLPYSSQSFKGYKFLDNGDLKLRDKSVAMFNAIENIYNYLLNDAELISNGVTALASQELCEEIRLASLGEMSQ